MTEVSEKHALKVFFGCEVCECGRLWPCPFTLDPPDQNCITLPDGDCVGGPCMHNPDVEVFDDRG